MKNLSGKPKKCKACRGYFVPARQLQVACCVSCAIAFSDSAREKKKAKDHALERAQHAKAKEAVKTRAQHLKEAQAAFNAVIRERDKDLPCISCGRYHEGKYDAGHYRSVGSSPELRFEPLNCWRQCVPCNRHKSGNAIDYRINLVKRIGLDKVEWLEGKHEPKRYTIEDVKALKAQFRAELRAMQSAN